MTRKPATSSKSSAEPEEKRTEPRAVAEGRRPTIDRESAQAIADANEASGFPVPPQIHAVLDAPIGDDAEPVQLPAAETAEPQPEA